MAGKKPKTASEPPNPLGWMVTFSDLVTLLLTFFVLLISMSSMDVKALEQSFGLFLTGGSGPLEYSTEGALEQLAKIIQSLEQIPPSVLIDQEEIKDEIFQFDDIEYQNLMQLVDRDITIKRDKRGIVIQMADYILFNEGGAQLRREYLPIISRVANVLRVSRRLISVEGHTDDSMLEGGSDIWAWELSLERAIALMDFFTLEEGLREDRFRVGGFGPSRPLFPNDSVQNRAKNRRIEIILYKKPMG